jgi:hypothetical protein
MLGGMTVAAIGLAILAATTKVDGSYLGILVGLAPMAIGMGCTFVPLTLVATTGLAKEDAGLASGCSTPPSRWAARSASRSSRRWPPTARRRT